MLNHEYVWSARLGCYVGKEGEMRAIGVEGRSKKNEEKMKAREQGKEKALGSEWDPMDIS
jgi:hypothetical protein